MAKRKQTLPKKKQKKVEIPKLKLIPKLKRRQYTDEDLKLALEEAKTGGCLSKIARKYQVPESTLRDKKKGKYADKKPGPSPVFSTEEEDYLKKWIFYSNSKGFPITKNKLLDSVQLLCEIRKKKTPFTDNRPGRSWYDGFLVRHPEVSSQILDSPIKIDKTELQVHNRLTEIITYLQDNNLAYINPNRIFNIGEIKVSLNPKDSTNLYSNVKDEVTVLVICSAEGSIIPPLVLFTGQNVSRDVIKNENSKITFASSDDRCMTPQNYYDHIANVFYLWLIDSVQEFPIVLYVDAQKFQISLPLCQFCEENQIVLLALPSVSSSVIQPLNFGFFQGFKNTWEDTLNNFCESQSLNNINQAQFSTVLQLTLENLDAGKIINGFKKCGLHPLDAGAIDFSEIVERDENVSSSSKFNANSGLSIARRNSIKKFEKYLDESTLLKFRSNDGPVWKGRIEDTSLFNIWYTLNHPDNSPKKSVCNVPENSEKEMEDLSVKFIQENKMIDEIASATGCGESLSCPVFAFDSFHST